MLMRSASACSSSSSSVKKTASHHGFVRDFAPASCRLNAQNGDHARYRRGSAKRISNSIDFESRNRSKSLEPSSEGFGKAFIRETCTESAADSKSLVEEEARKAEASRQKNMVELDPGNPLLLRNYAKFLHELKDLKNMIRVREFQVEVNLDKAEEYYQRAILASPRDGEVISLYANFIWKARNDASRAEDYFSQAAKASPDDCYVLSAHANFLWNYEEENESSSKG